MQGQYRIVSVQALMLISSLFFGRWCGLAHEFLTESMQCILLVRCHCFDSVLMVTYLFGSNYQCRQIVWIPRDTLSSIKLFSNSWFAKLALNRSIAQGCLAKRQNNIKDFKEHLCAIIIAIGLICDWLRMLIFPLRFFCWWHVFWSLFIGRVPVKYFGECL